MKRILLLAALGVFTFASAQAQEIRFGVKGGVNIASLGGDSYVGGVGVGSLSSRTSFHIGGFAEIPLGGDFALQPEVLYSSEGSDWGGIFTSGSDLKLDYIRVPVLAKYNMPFVEGLSVELGPVFGVLVSDSGGEKFAWGDNAEFNSFDVQIGIGATYRFNFGLEAGLRYNKGILNVYDANTRDGYSEPKSQSNVFQIFAGYSF